LTVGGLNWPVAVEGSPAAAKAIIELNPSLLVGVIVIGTETEFPAATTAVDGMLTEKSSIAS
jgi:hypothetical protein